MYYYCNSCREPLTNDDVISGNDMYVKFRCSNCGDECDANDPDNCYRIDSDLIVYPVNEKFLMHCVELAEDNKIWAKSKKTILNKGMGKTEELIEDKEWWKNASDMSKKMVDEYLQKETGQIAAEKYNYKYYRSHLKTEHGLYLDPTAKKYWEEVTGETLK